MPSNLPPGVTDAMISARFDVVEDCVICKKPIEDDWVGYTETCSLRCEHRRIRQDGRAEKQIGGQEAEAFARRAAERMFGIPAPYWTKDF